MSEDISSWAEWSRWVIKNIEEIKLALKDIHVIDLTNITKAEKDCREGLVELLNNIQTNLTKKINEVDNRVSVLEIKSSLWGILGGLLGFIALKLMKM